MAIGIDGLVSNLDTTALITELMKIEAAPQAILRGRVASTQTALGALRELNTQIARIAELAKGVAAPRGLAIATGASDIDGVAVTAAGTATPGRLDVRVDRTAAAHTIVTAPSTVWPDDPAVIVIVDADGTATEVTASSSSPAALAAAVNAADLGVTATAIASGTDPGTGQPLFRVQFTAAATGAAGAFSVFRGTDDDHAAGTAVDVLDAPGAALVRSGADAQVTLWAGTAAEQTLTSASNTFEDLLPGVDVTVSAAAVGRTASVSVDRDAEAVTAKATEFAAAITAALDTIAKRTAVTAGTNATGGSTVATGVLTGDGATRATRDALVAAVSMPVGGRSPSTIGLSLTETGSVAFDAERFAAAHADDPDAATATLQALAARVEEAAAAASDPYEGRLTTRISTDETVLRGLDRQIADWNDRLAARRSMLERTYAALEVRLSNLNAQSSWLASQLAGLSTGTGNA